MGKTSTASAFNVNGRAGWVMQELVAPLTLLATIHASPARARADGRLPVAHLWLAGLFCAHYLHRSLLSPLRNPSMAPTHALLTLAAVAFNLANGSAIGAWLGGYGSAATVPVWQLGLGSALFLLGLCGNVYHEEVLRDIRRTSGNPATSGAAAKDGNEAPAVSSADGQRLYKIPQGGLFAYCYYPHVCPTPLSLPLGRAGLGLTNAKVPVRVGGVGRIRDCWRRAGQLPARDAVSRQRDSHHGSARPAGQALVPGQVWRPGSPPAQRRCSGRAVMALASAPPWLV